MSRAFHPLDPRGARTRIAAAIALGIVAWLALPTGWTFAIRALAAWDASAIVLLAVAGWIILGADVAETRRRAAAADPGRVLSWSVAFGGSAVSVIGAATVVHGAANQSGFELGLCVATVALSWFVTHAAFTLRYAHLYYGGVEGGLAFPGDEAPDDTDFAYFAFTIGMCFQVSDVSITTRRIRRTTLLHAMVSFLYNTIIVALVLNLVVGHLG